MDETQILREELGHYRTEKEHIRKIIGQIGGKKGKGRDQIIWMINGQTKIEHFQFWILNSIEFQINLLTKRLKEIDERLR